MIQTTQTVWKASTTSATILTLDQPAQATNTAPALLCHAYKLTVGEALDLADALASAIPLAITLTLAAEARERALNPSAATATSVLAPV